MTTKYDDMDKETLLAVIESLEGQIELHKALRDCDSKHYQLICGICDKRPDWSYPCTAEKPK
jgi:hypothetical protein